MICWDGRDVDAEYLTSWEILEEIGVVFHVAQLRYYGIMKNRHQVVAELLDMRGCFGPEHVGNLWRYTNQDIEQALAYSPRLV